MVFVASKMLRPANSENNNQGRWGPTECAHAFYPESAFAATVPEVSTWNGSDESNVFKGKCMARVVALCRNARRRAVAPWLVWWPQSCCTMAVVAL
jgi:hypothetical protein